MSEPGSIKAPTEVEWLNPDEEQAWIGLMGILLKLPGLLDSQLREEGLGLFDYTVLGSLSMAPGRSMRMSSLAELSNGSLSRLSNVVKRLEGLGYLRREADPQDGRYTVAILTEPGWEKVVAAAPGHVRTVRHFVFDGLTAEQVDQLSRIGAHIHQKLQTGLPCLGDSGLDCGSDC